MDRWGMQVIRIEANKGDSDEFNIQSLQIRDGKVKYHEGEELKIQGKRYVVVHDDGFHVNVYDPDYKISGTWAYVMATSENGSSVGNLGSEVYTSKKEAIAAAKREKTLTYGEVLYGFWLGAVSDIDGYRKKIEFTDFYGMDGKQRGGKGLSQTKDVNVQSVIDDVLNEINHKPVTQGAALYHRYAVQQIVPAYVDGQLGARVLIKQFRGKPLADVRVGVLNELQAIYEREFKRAQRHGVVEDFDDVRLKDESEKERKIVYETATQTAIKVRIALKEAFPYLPARHFKVRKDGNSVWVKWQDYPMEDEVNKVVKKYESSRFDGMTDSTTSTPYEEDGVLYHGADYVLTERKISDERRTVLRTICENVYGDWNSLDRFQQWDRESKIDKDLDINNWYVGELNLSEYGLDNRGKRAGVREDVGADIADNVIKEAVERVYSHLNKNPGIVKKKVFREYSADNYYNRLIVANINMDTEEQVFSVVEDFLNNEVKKDVGNVLSVFKSALETSVSEKTWAAGLDNRDEIVKYVLSQVSEDSIIRYSNEEGYRDLDTLHIRYAEDKIEEYLSKKADSDEWDSGESMGQVKVLMEDSIDRVADQKMGELHRFIVRKLRGSNRSLATRIKEDQSLIASFEARAESDLRLGVDINSWVDDYFRKAADNVVKEIEELVNRDILDAFVKEVKIKGKQVEDKQLLKSFGAFIGSSDNIISQIKVRPSSGNLTIEDETKRFIEEKWVEFQRGEDPKSKKLESVIKITQEDKKYVLEKIAEAVRSANDSGVQITEKDLRKKVTPKDVVKLKRSVGGDESKFYIGVNKLIESAVKKLPESGSGEFSVDDLIRGLLLGEVKLVFRKVNGVTRKMVATRNTELISDFDEEDAFVFADYYNRQSEVKKQVSGGTIPVFDMEKGEIRSFVLDRVISYQIGSGTQAVKGITQNQTPEPKGRYFDPTDMETQKIIKVLEDKVVRLVFEKKDGSKRPMVATRNHDLIELYMSKGTSQLSANSTQIDSMYEKIQAQIDGDYVKVFDLSKCEFRMFKPSKLLNYDFDNNVGSWLEFSTDNDAWYDIAQNGEKPSKYYREGSKLAVNIGRSLSERFKFEQKAKRELDELLYTRKSLEKQKEQVNKQNLKDGERKQRLGLARKQLDDYLKSIAGVDFNEDFKQMFERLKNVPGDLNILESMENMEQLAGIVKVLESSGVVIMRINRAYFFMHPYFLVNASSGRVYVDKPGIFKLGKVELMDEDVAAEDYLTEIAEDIKKIKRRSKFKITALEGGDVTRLERLVKVADTHKEDAARLGIRFSGISKTEKLPEHVAVTFGRNKWLISPKFVCDITTGVPSYIFKRKKPNATLSELQDAFKEMNLNQRKDRDQIKWVATIIQTAFDLRKTVKA